MPPQITAVAAPISPSKVLGCGVARAEVWTRGGGQRVMDLPNINSVTWSRLRGDTSMGEVEMDGVAIGADPACCALMNTIRPWKHELHVYRDDKRSWLGPITEMPLDAGKLVIKARDISAWLDRRFIHAKHQYGGQQAGQGSVDSATVFQDIVLDGFAPDTSPLGVGGSGTPFVLQGQAYDLVQRTYTPAQFKPCAPELRDLAKGNLDWTIVKRSGFVGQISTWVPVVPNPVINPTFEVNTAGWTGLTRDTGVFHSGVASGRTGAPPAVTGSIVGLTVGQKYLMRTWVRGTSSALDAGQKFIDDGLVTVGNDQSSIFSWYVYGQPLNANNDNPGRNFWAHIGVYFTATATTMPIAINASGNPIDSNGIYFDDFDVYQQVPSFTLRDYSLAVPPKITLSGLDQQNRSIAANQQTGGDYAFYAEAPKPAWALGGFGPGLTPDQTEFGLLEQLHVQPLADAATAASAAANRVAALGSTPLLIDQLILAPSAGVTIDQLVPGVMFTLRLDEPCFAVQSNLILQSVTVKTTAAAGEQITLTFQPTGY